MNSNVIDRPGRRPRAITIIACFAFIVVVALVIGIEGLISAAGITVFFGGIVYAMVSPAKGPRSIIKETGFAMSLVAFFAYVSFLVLYFISLGPIGGP